VVPENKGSEASRDRTSKQASRLMILWGYALQDWPAKYRNAIAECLDVDKEFDPSVFIDSCE